MTYSYLSPEWFFGYDVLLEVGFAIISLFVAFYAHKIYKLTQQRQPKLFSISFSLISISYFIQSLVNFAIISKLNENICRVLKIQDVVTLNSIGIYLYMLFFISGLTVFTYMTLKVESKRTFFLILTMSLLSIILSANKLYVFYLISSIMLLFIVIHYFQIYIKKKKAGNLLGLVAFLFLLFSTMHFIFSVNHGLFYMIGHILEFIAYILILINLLLALKK